MAPPRSSPIYGGGRLPAPGQPDRCWSNWWRPSDAKEGCESPSGTAGVLGRMQTTSITGHFIAFICIAPSGIRNLAPLHALAGVVRANARVRLPPGSPTPDLNRVGGRRRARNAPGSGPGAKAVSRRTCRMLFSASRCERRNFDGMPSTVSRRKHQEPPHAAGAGCPAEVSLGI